jgi:hypothetical protein
MPGTDQPQNGDFPVGQTGWTLGAAVRVLVASSRQDRVHGLRIQSAGRRLRLQLPGGGVPLHGGPVGTHLGESLARIGGS